VVAAAVVACAQLNLPNRPVFDQDAYDEAFVGAQSHRQRHQSPRVKDDRARQIVERHRAGEGVVQLASAFRLHRSTIHRDLADSGVVSAARDGASLDWVAIRADEARDRDADSPMCRIVCEEAHMATNLAIDPQLLNDAQAVSGLKTKKEAVTVALQEFIARRAQAKAVESFGTLQWDESYDYKADRRSGDQGC